jgi:hypothetical protein
MNFDGSTLGLTGQGVSFLYDNGNVTGTATVNWNNGNVQRLRFTGSTVLSYSNQKVGGVYSLQIEVGATGATAGWPTGTKWPGGTPVTLSTNAASIDFVSIIVGGTGSTFYTVGQNDFK